MYAPQSFEQLDIEDYYRIMKTNADGTFFVTKAVLPWMKQQNSGYILNILSTACHNPSANNGPYSASKCAVQALTKTLAAECRNSGIKVSSISPGPIATTIWNNKITPPTDAVKKKMLNPRDIAELVWFYLTRPDNVYLSDVIVEPWYF